jgi:hypothetical protein
MFHGDAPTGMCFQLPRNYTTDRAGAAGRSVPRGYGRFAGGLKEAPASSRRGGASRGRHGTEKALLRKRRRYKGAASAVELARDNL